MAKTYTYINESGIYEKGFLFILGSPFDYYLIMSCGKGICQKIITHIIVHILKAVPFELYNFWMEQLFYRM